ncbi:hypothetical protein KGY73_08000 [bacterium]|nr:hypothetical protein [bacterium]
MRNKNPSRDEKKTQKKSSKYEREYELERKLRHKNKELKRLKKETRELLSELDKAYKGIRKSQGEKIIDERLNLASEFTAELADRLKNSLNVMSLSVQYLSEKFNDENEKKELTEKIMEKIGILNNMAMGLLNFAKPHKPELKTYSVHKVLDNALNLLKFQCIEEKVEVVKDYSSKILPVKMDMEMMEQVFLNILDNSLWAMKGGGTLSVTTRFLSPQKRAQIIIKDTGVGIPQGNLQKIFDPLFSNKRNAVGLGLSVAYRIIQQHKGSIEVQSQEGKGTTIFIELPVAR